MREIPAQLISLILLSLFLGGNTQSSTTETKTCALLFKNTNFTGDQYVFGDEAQVSNFNEEHISAVDVWNETLSFTLEKGCHITLCNETYFNGNCKKMSESLQELPAEFETILSASCSCEKKCKCSDINMRSTSCARAYFKPGCNVCNPYYTDLKGNKAYFPEEYHGKIAAVKVRDGCNLIIYDEEEFEGNPININGTVEKWTEPIGSYECTCSPDSYKPRTKPPRPSTYPTFLDMPTTIEEVTTMLSGDLGGHPGLLAAKKSLRNRRSSKNVYILTIGSTGAGKSSAINLLFDNPNVTLVGGAKSITKEIHEFRIPLPIDELGVANSELRVIDTPGMGDTEGIPQDAKFLATLDDYLSNHEELSNRIPNVVLIFHKFNDNRFSGTASNFVKMLRGFDSFRSKITDSKFSNVIFVLSHFCAELKTIKTRPNEKLAEFKATIENFSLFPKPIMIVVAENKAVEQDLQMVNGYFKLPNGDYYPRNLFDKIKFVTSNGGDPIGEAVITTGFRDADEFNITSTEYRLVNTNDKRVQKYQDILISSVIEIEDTEISQLLAKSYDGMNATLKKTYTGALYYLQKALSVRDIRTKSDIPKTTMETLTLLSSITQNEAIMYLLENGLDIKPPVYTQNVVAGYGYNVFKDSPITKSPFKLGEVVSSDIGYLFPSAMTCSVDNKGKDVFEIPNSRADYLKQRLLSLGIDGTVSEEKFTKTIKPGYNIKTESFQANSCKVTAVREFRTFSLTLNNKPVLTEEFKEVLLNLPVFNESIHENVKTWEIFFENYGTHVVKNVYGGGAIEIELTSNKGCDGNMTQTLVGLVQFAEDLTALTNESKAALTGGEIRHHLTFRGGNHAYHTSDLTKMKLDASFELMQNWKESLRLNPTILTTEMQLLPMSEIAKKVGQNQNISAEILRVTGLLFDSKIIYIPPSKTKGPKPGREDEVLRKDINPAFDTLIQAFLAQSRESAARFDKIMEKMREDQLAAEVRREEAQIKHYEWLERQEKLRLDNFKLDREERDRREEIRRKEEEQRKKDYEEAEKRRTEEGNRHERERISADEARRAKEKEDERKRLEALKTPDGSCLKKGTLILLANGREKPVEELEVGEFVLDHELNPTRVMGISNEFLLHQNFHGFDNKSFFFTNSHILVGPQEGDSDQELQFYVKDRPKLVHENPLMKFIGIRSMDDVDKFDVYNFDKTSGIVASKSVKVYKDPIVYPVDTLVYFIQVENPAGTYFANGYICRHEIPPIQFWPNTMAILFSLHTNPDFMSFSNVPYTLSSIATINDIVSDIKEKVEDTLNLVSVQDLSVEDPRIELDSHNAEIVINGIFNHPSFSVFGMGLYSRVGWVMSKYLDDCKVNSCISDEYLGSLQKLLTKEISMQITKSVQSKLKNI